MIISTKHSKTDTQWKELIFKFAFFPKILDDGTLIWFKTYQRMENGLVWKGKYLLRRNLSDTLSIIEFKKNSTMEHINRLEKIN